MEPDETDPVVDEGVEALVRQELGDELDYLPADKLASAISKVTERIVAEQIKPLQARQERLIVEANLRESGETLDAFGKQHPDWREHEDAMVELMKKFPPGQDAKGQPLMSELEYLDVLYGLATKDQPGNRAPESPARKTTTGSSSRSGTADRLPTFAEAFAAAGRGEHLDK